MTSFAHVAALLLALPGGAIISVDQSRIQNQTHPYFRKIRLPLANGEDLSYKMNLRVGNQYLDVIPDTGSFELVVFSKLCGFCGDIKQMFDPSKSKTFSETKLQAQQSYGSGDTLAKYAHDRTLVGDHIVVSNQPFWNVFDANMPVLQDETFQGIFGLGPPSGNLIITRQESEEIQDQFQKAQQSGVDVSQYVATVQSVQDVAVMARSQELWLTSARMKLFSICIQRAQGSEGYVTFNDDTDLSHFQTHIKVQGNTYWSAALSNVHIGDPSDHGLNLGCGGNDTCMAMLDTGTSLIAVPDAVLNPLAAAIDGWLGDMSNGCQDLSDMPDLTFRLGGELLSLPPESYIGEVEADNFRNYNFKYMPHLKARYDRLIKAKGKETWDRPLICAPLVMSTGDDPMWIFGLPFFRKYYTLFRLDDDRQSARSMSLSEADDNCRPTMSPKYKSDVRRPTVRAVPLRVDLNKLRPPRRTLRPHDALLKMKPWK